MVPSSVSVHSVRATFGSVGSSAGGKRAAARDRLVDGGRDQQRQPGAVGERGAIHVGAGGDAHVIIPQRTTV
jgi:hypothetical protein